jgi:peptide/nickel transport system substrate-binding protein
MYGLGRPGVTTYHPDAAWADERIGPIPFDPAGAARLLEAAGWIDRDGDGVRDREGRPFTFELLVANSAQKLPDHIAAWQQQSWAELGLRARIVNLEWQAFRERRNSGNFDAAGFTLSMTPNPDQFDLYHSTASESGFNFYGLADPELDRLIEEGRQTFERKARGEIYDRLQARLVELEPLTCLFHFATPLLYDRRLAGIVPSAIGYAATTEGPRRWHWSDGADQD